MNDDLNTPLAVATLFDAVSAANARPTRVTKHRRERVAISINSLFGALGLSLVAGSHLVDEVSEALVERARRGPSGQELGRSRPTT